MDNIKQSKCNNPQCQCKDLPDPQIEGYGVILPPASESSSSAKANDNEPKPKNGEQSQ